MQTLKEMKARLWHADLRLWIWRWQTLSLKDRAVFYRGRRSGQKGTEHKSLKNFNLDTEHRRWKRNRPKEFDAPYLLTMSAKNGGWVRYQLLPALMYGHHVDFVHYDIEVNPDGSRVKFPSGMFHCVDCKLMGNQYTMERYTCCGSTKIDWMEECGCSQCKRGGEPCTWAAVSRICHKI